MGAIIMVKYWKQIKKKYPQAFNGFMYDKQALIDLGLINENTLADLLDEKWALRYLYDFFDSKKINVICYTANSKEWRYEILIKGHLVMKSVHLYLSRKKAELEAYQAAFALMQKQLNPNI